MQNTLKTQNVNVLAIPAHTAPRKLVTEQRAHSAVYVLNLLLATSTLNSLQEMTGEWQSPRSGLMKRLLWASPLPSTSAKELSQGLLSLSRCLNCACAPTCTPAFFCWQNNLTHRQPAAFCPIRSLPVNCASFQLMFFSFSLLCI